MNVETRKYAFWNNKGGTGKTSLLFQAVTMYAEQHPERDILVLDLCPQANLSELFLGGLEGGGSDTLGSLQMDMQRRTVGGYFETRLPAPYTKPNIEVNSFLTRPSHFNVSVPSNISLLAGDSLLELQSNAIATLANAQIPGQQTWLAVVDWITDFIHATGTRFSRVFIDTNPSFSMYTQIALSSASHLVLPTMADDSSRRAIQNAFALVHGHLQSPNYADYSFVTKLKKANRHLPMIHLIPRNRLTQYMGAASAYASVMQRIQDFVMQAMQDSSDIFSFNDIENGFVDIRDFQTTGVVAFAEGKPFTKLNPGIHNVGGRETQVNQENINNCIEAMSKLIEQL